MKKIGLFAYGEMGEAALQATLNHFDILWVVLPGSNRTHTEERTYNLAKKHKISIVNPGKSFNISTLIKKDKPNIVLICSYNKILQESVLNLSNFVNVHLGDLPKFRGRANVNWAIILGRKKINITIHDVVAELDAGNIFQSFTIPISDVDTVGDVYLKINKKLITSLASLLKKVLQGFPGKKQSGQATYLPTRLAEDGLIDWSKKSVEIYNFIRAISRPYPGAFTFYKGKKMIVWNAEKTRDRIYEATIPGRIGRVIKGKGVEVLTGDSSLIIKEVTFDNREMNASQIIKSTKETLGIDMVAVYEHLNKSNEY